MVEREARGSPAVRVNVFSTPRTLSTALLYSFGSRPDCVAVDEPLYAHHLTQSPHLQASRPYVKDLFESQSQDGAVVVDQVILGPVEKPVLYMKHMAKQIINLDLSFIAKTRNVLLIRDPIKMLASWANKLPSSLEETGYVELLKLLEVIKAAGQEVLVVDSDDLQVDPEGILRSLCDRLDIPWYPEQLMWSAGPKPFDGVWAPFWYDQVHKSTGFGTMVVGEEATTNGGACHSSKTLNSFPPDLIPLLRICMPFYEALKFYAIRPSGSKSSGSIKDHGLIHSLAPDPINLDILVWVGGRLVPREMAKVSVFDSVVQGGDAVWEGLRIYDGRVFHLSQHLRRLRDSAKAMDFKAIPTEEEVKSALFQCLAANNMRDGVHVRLTLTRGLKTTSSMNPMFNVYGCTLIILPEHKPVGGVATYDNEKGIKLITATNRRNPPQCVDSKIHHNNLINNILPKIQANYGGAQDAIMLDVDGFVSETNATNIFMVKDGVLLTPHADHCLPGITRQTVMDLARKIGIPLVERRISLAEFHAAEEVFTTGTMGELSPVREIDGRAIVDGAGPMTRKLQEAYRQLTETEGLPLPAFA